MSVTFRINDVAPTDHRTDTRTASDAFSHLIDHDRRALEADRKLLALRHERSSKDEALKARVDRVPLGRLHACRVGAPLARITELHPFFDALMTAYNLHHPLSLSPDHVWALVLQGLSHHIRQNADALRDRFVQHTGRKTLKVRRDGFVHGVPDNDWAGGFEEFCGKIRGHIGPQADGWTMPFSTTGSVEQAVFHLSLMDSMQHYFHYEVYILCGIPDLTLEGTVQDWRSLLSRAAQLDSYGLSWWTARLLPVLEHFVRAAEGAPDLSFWRSLVNHRSMSGSNEYTGWMTHLIPYTRKGERNPLLAFTPSEMGDVTLTAAEYEAQYGPRPPWMRGETHTVTRALEARDIPGGLHQVPFTCYVLNLPPIEMSWAGGFVGCAQERERGTLRPELGWAVLGP